MPTETKQLRKIIVKDAAGNITECQFIADAILGIDTKIGTSVETYVSEHKAELKGDKGDTGADGTSMKIKDSAETCIAEGDGYIDANGHLQVLDSISPRHFTDVGEIKGPKGDTGPQGPQGEKGETGAALEAVLEENDDGTFNLVL